MLVGLLVGLAQILLPQQIAAQGNGGPSEIAPGFGFVYGEGKTSQDGRVTRGGFTSRRLTDNDRVGSLALLAEQHEDGLRFTSLTENLTEDQVSIRYQSVYLEMKRYLPFYEGITYYWGIRGGYSRIRGEETSSGERRKFEEDLFAPLAILALPLMIENPGFLLLAFTDGTSVGMTVDIVPERIWLDYQISAVMVPRYRNAVIALDDLTMITQVLQLMIVF